MKRQKCIFFFLILIGFIPVVSAQITFQKLYDIGSFDFIEAVRPTSDGGYILAGWNTGIFFSDGILIKTDSLGNVIWAKSYNGGLYTLFNHVEQTSDGGFIVTGENTYGFFSAQTDLLLMKTDPSGNVTWAKNIGGSDADGGHFVRPTSDGGYIVTGYSYSYSSKDSANAYLVKTTSSGAVSWGKVIQLSAVDDDYGYGVEEVNGGFVLSGMTTEINGQDTTTDILLLKVNTVGALLWAKTIGGINDSEEGYFIENSSDNNLWLGGLTSQTATGIDGSDHLLIKLDLNGILLFAYAYDAGMLDITYELQQTTDGGIALFGTTFSLFSFTFLDNILIKLSGTGSIQWSKVYTRSANHNFLRSGRQSPDEGYILAGWGQTNSSAFQEFMLIKTDGNGSAGCLEQTLVLSRKTYNPVIANVTPMIFNGTNSSNASIGVSNVAPGITVLCEFNPCATLAVTGNIINESCSPGNDGSIQLTVTGGASPYGYLWSNGETTQTLSGLSAGLYEVTVTDNNNCTVSSGFNVNKGNPSGPAGLWQWTGILNDDWFEPCNWDKVTVPGINAPVVIPGNTPFNPLIRSQAFCRDIQIHYANGAIVRIDYAAGGKLTVQQ